MIRNSKRSWEMKIRRHADMLEFKEFDGILSHWMELRVINFKIEPDFARFGLSLKAHRSLEKIVILSGPGLYTIGSHHSRPQSLHYSSVPNSSACTFINFEEKIHPARPYLGLHVYLFQEKFPPCTFIPPYMFIEFFYFSLLLLFCRQNREQQMVTN